LAILSLVKVHKAYKLALLLGNKHLATGDLLLKRSTQYKAKCMAVSVCQLLDSIEVVSGCLSYLG
jgi:hypothetical protein